MGKEFDLAAHLTKGIEGVVREAIAATLKNPRESAFMARYAAATVRAAKKRQALEAQGEHIPTFLIASITSACNLHCEGCYSRHNEATTDCAPTCQLTQAEWDRIFCEARDIGVCFILLAGGEPLLRKDVIEAAANYPEIIFPIFTNGVYVAGDYFELFDRKRNLLPVLSIEGGRESTDARRGEGIYDLQVANMAEFKKRGLIFGASITVTHDNLDDVTSDAFLDELEARGCKAVIFVEFVPVTRDSEHLALSNAERAALDQRINARRATHDGMVLVSFPGDEQATGGCVAAGRGFFHINSHGGAEPCPFSPYSDTNVRETSLREALKSPLFHQLIDSGMLMEEHTGGCTLFARKADVEALL